MEYRSLTLDDFLSRFQLLRPQINRETLNHRQAAVLIPIVRRPQPGLLLTQRSIHLRKHAGQVAFPGGAVDDTDASVIAAALREAEEEVAIPPSAVEVIGVLPPVDSVTGYQVTPVVALSRPICRIAPVKMKSRRCLKCRSPGITSGSLSPFRYLPPWRFTSGMAVLVRTVFCMGNDRRHNS